MLLEGMTAWAGYATVALSVGLVVVLWVKKDSIPMLYYIAPLLIGISLLS